MLVLMNNRAVDLTTYALAIFAGRMLNLVNPNVSPTSKNAFVLADVVVTFVSEDCLRVQKPSSCRRLNLQRSRVAHAVDILASDLRKSMVRSTSRSAHIAMVVNDVARFYVMRNRVVLYAPTESSLSLRSLHPTVNAIDPMPSTGISGFACICAELVVRATRVRPNVSTDGIFESFFVFEELGEPDHDSTLSK